MAIKRHKRGGRVYLVEYKNVREGKRVKSIFIRYIGPEDGVKSGKIPKKRVLDKLRIEESHRAGDIRLLWKIAQDLDFVGTIDRFCCGDSSISGPSPGKFLTSWAINRALDPESCTQLERWIPTTDLPTLAGMPADAFTKDAFLSTLDFICCKDKFADRYVDHTVVIGDELYQKWRQLNPLPAGEKETVAYDITSVLFFGVRCPLAEIGHNAKNIKLRQANLALLVSKLDKFPVTHLVFNGSRNSVSTVKNLISRLDRSPVEPGTIIWDRGNVSEDHIESVERAGWKLICGIPQTSKAAKKLINETDVPITPETFVRSSKGGHLYAIKRNAPILGKSRSSVVYINPTRKVMKTDLRNEELAIVGMQLNALSEKGKNWSEKTLHREINIIVKPWKEYVQTRVKRKGDGPRIEWHFAQRSLNNDEKNIGKWLLLSTDESLSAKDIVDAYLEKDFIEKVFKTFKSGEEIEPVRHRLDYRVRAYIFVCVLAYTLLSVLQWKLRNAELDDDVWDSSDALLRRLARVERVEVGFGKEVKTWYLNLTTSDADTLKAIGLGDLLKDEIRLKM